MQGPLHVGLYICCRNYSNTFICNDYSLLHYFLVTVKCKSPWFYNVLIIAKLKVPWTGERRKFGYNVSVRPLVRTDAMGEGRESNVSPSGEEYVIAEVKFSISRSSLVSAVNHKAARTFREKKTKRQESFFPLNFNVYINLENNFVGGKTGKLYSGG